MGMAVTLRKEPERRVDDDEPHAARRQPLQRDEAVFARHRNARRKVVKWSKLRSMLMP